MDGEDLGYLDKFVEDTSSAMSEVMRLVDALLQAKARVEEAEQELSNREKLERELREQIIPSFMAQHRLNDIGLENGLRVEVEDALSASLPKDEAKKRRVLDFLMSNEGGDIIKEEVSFEDADAETIAFLQEREISFNRTTTVNAAQFKAFFRHGLGYAKNSVARFQPADVPPEANLYLYRTTKITGKKKE